MPIEKYRSVEEMPPPWREPGDPENVRQIVTMMNLYWSINERPSPGVRAYHSLEELQQDDPSPLRR